VRDLRVHALTALRVVHELKREFDGWIDPKGYEVTHND
jgi:transposase